MSYIAQHLFVYDVCHSDPSAFVLIDVNFSLPPLCFVYPDNSDQHQPRKLLAATLCNHTAVPSPITASPNTLAIPATSSGEDLVRIQGHDPLLGPASTSSGYVGYLSKYSYPTGMRPPLARQLSTGLAAFSKRQKWALFNALRRPCLCKTNTD